MKELSISTSIAIVDTHTHSKKRPQSKVNFQKLPTFQSYTTKDDENLQIICPAQVRQTTPPSPRETSRSKPETCALSSDYMYYNFTQTLIKARERGGLQVQETLNHKDNHKQSIFSFESAYSSVIRAAANTNKYIADTGMSHIGPSEITLFDDIVKVPQLNRRSPGIREDSARSMSPKSSLNNYKTKITGVVDMHPPLVLTLFRVQELQLDSFLDKVISRLDQLAANNKRWRFPSLIRLYEPPASYPM